MASMLQIITTPSPESDVLKVTRLNYSLGALSVVGLFIGGLLFIFWATPSSLYHNPPALGLAIFLLFMSTFCLKSFFIGRQHQQVNR
jgi:hypothetical protein